MKLGPMLCVPLKSDIAFSQRSGIWATATPGSRHAEIDRYIGNKIPYRRPRSWKCGTQEMIRLALSWPSPWSHCVRLCKMFRWDSITPLGLPVEPEVY